MRACGGVLEHPVEAATHPVGSLLAEMPSACNARQLWPWAQSRARRHAPCATMPGAAAAAPCGTAAVLVLAVDPMRRGAVPLQGWLLSPKVAPAWCQSEAPAWRPGAVAARRGRCKWRLAAAEERLDAAGRHQDAAAWRLNDACLATAAPGCSSLGQLLRHRCYSPAAIFRNAIHALKLLAIMNLMPAKGRGASCGIKADCFVTSLTTHVFNFF